MSSDSNAKDNLCDADEFGVTQYLLNIYKKMGRYTMNTDHVIEVCARHDRGVISLPLIPHAKWTNIDRAPYRPGLNLDVLRDQIPGCDVLLSTAILHHTPPGKQEDLMRRLCGATGRILMLSGPNIRVMPDLEGDHEYHIDGAEICGYAHDNGFGLVRSERVGLTEPFAELLLVFRRDP